MRTNQTPDRNRSTELVRVVAAVERILTHVPLKNTMLWVSPRSGEGYQLFTHPGYHALAWQQFSQV